MENQHDDSNPMEETLETDRDADLDADLDIALDSAMDADFEEQSESEIQEQLQRLALAIDKSNTEVEQTLKSIEGDSEDTRQALLEQQILEDQILSAEDEAIAIANANAEQNSGQSSEQNTEGNSEERLMDIHEIQSCLEAILFIADKPVTFEKLKQMIGNATDSELFQQAISELQARYQGPEHGIELLEIAGGYQFRTKVSRAHLAQRLVRVQTQRLSGGMMETLAIVAYKQPVMKEEIDKIRGVDSSYFIRGLIDKKLMTISGRSEAPGRPILYSTTPDFLEIFGLKDLSSMPPLRELEQMVPQSTTSSDEDDPRTKEMRRMVREMRTAQDSQIYYDPKEDEKILKEIRENVSSIPTSTPYLDDLKAAELAAQQAEKEAAAMAAAPPSPPSPAPAL